MSISAPSLRPYQVDAIRMIDDAIASGYKRTILSMPTGTGKSVVMLDLIIRELAAGRRVTVVLNRVQLVHQFSEHLKRANVPHGIAQSTNTARLYERCLICSIDTIHARGYPDSDFLLIDESHGCAGSMKYRKMLEHYKDKPVVGVTATHWAKGLGKAYQWGELFERVLCPITIEKSISEGYLCDVDIYAPTNPDLSKVKIVAGDYHEGQLGDAMDKTPMICDIADNWVKHCSGKKTIVFSTNIPHSQHITAEFNARGVSAAHIDYTMEFDDKQQLINDYKDGKYTVLSNCSLLSEGFDVPETAVMILARPTKSFLRYVQMAGRVLRPFDGKERAVIYDHSGSTVDLGYPTVPMPLVLCDGRPKKSGPSKEKKKDKGNGVCPSCKFIKPVAVHKCPCCGFAPERKNVIKTIEGELKILGRGKSVIKSKLVLADEQEVVDIKKSLAHISNVPKEELYGMLLEICKQRRYSSGWVGMTYKSIHGVWPNGLPNKHVKPITLVTNYIKSRLIAFSKSRG